MENKRKESEEIKRFISGIVLLCFSDRYCERGKTTFLDMRIDKFHIFFVVFGLSKSEKQKDSGAMARVKQGFERLDVNRTVSVSSWVSTRKRFQRCVRGTLVVVQNDPAVTNSSSAEFFATEQYRVVDCYTDKPKCGTKSTKISWKEKGQKAVEISFGCFPATELKDGKRRELASDSSELAIEMNDFRDIYVGQIASNLEFFVAFSGILVFGEAVSSGIL